MGEVDTSAAPPAPMIDLTAVEVNPAIGERYYKAAIVHSKQGTTYRMVAKTLPDGRLDLVHFVCDLGADGTMFGKRRVRRIESQPVTRFDAEIETIKKDITASGEEVQGVWEHDLMKIQDVAEQVGSLDAWMVTTAKEISPA
ncbi:MAG: hypothetical protein NPIRA04_31360 [Nitrospirales bacterium]|nr:MAG: hypothetical protein NPIRA04_31360 [Nitrospirales bacterium]